MSHTDLGVRHVWRIVRAKISTQALPIMKVRQRLQFRLIMGFFLAAARAIATS